MRCRTLLVALLLLSWGPALAGRDGEELPGYYQFFKKAGSLQRLPSESERDELIARGDLRPVTLEGELVDLSLPDARNESVSLRALAEGRHLVVIPFRTWW